MLGDESTLSADEYRGLRFALYGLLGVIAFILLLTLPPGAPLRDPETGAIIGNTPFMSSLIVTIALIFLVCGICYGLGAGTMKSVNDVVNAMTKAIASLSGLILLLLVISQFIAYFNYSNMATLAAISLADVLTEANLGPLWLLVGFVIVVFILDLVITGAIPKWAIFAPVFIPLLMRLNVEPEAVLAAYRVGDSPMNAITPLERLLRDDRHVRAEVPEGLGRRHGDRADAAVHRGPVRAVDPAAGGLVPARAALGARLSATDSSVPVPRRLIPGACR